MKGQKRTTGKAAASDSPETLPAEGTTPETTEYIPEATGPHGAPTVVEMPEMPPEIKGAPPLQISRDDIKIPARARAPKRPYWVGLKSRDNPDGSTGLPFFHWSVGGVTFAFKQGPIVNDSFQGPDGGVVHLTDEAKDNLLSQVARFVIRPVGNQYRVLEVDTPRYNRDPRDVPIACYLYIYPLDPNNEQNRPTLDPVPLMMDWE